MKIAAKMIGLAFCCALATGCAKRYDFSDPLVQKTLPAPSLAKKGRVRFAIVGDFGYHSEVWQREMAFRIRAVCEAPETRCDFLVADGDNLYYAGFDQRNAAGKFHQMLENYGPTPKYLVLGNHDYHPLIYDEQVGRQELQFIRDTAGVYGDAHFWRTKAGPLELIGIDTDYMVRGAGHSEDDDGLRGWFESLGQPDTPWRIMVGHHPYLSNGKHGNAGTYLLDSGIHFKRVFEKHIAGRTHLYIDGHDHNLQFYPKSAPDGPGAETALAVIGSSGKCSGKGADNNPDDSGVAPVAEQYGFGFAWVEVTSDRLFIRYHDVNGEPFFEAERKKGGPWTWPKEALSSKDRCGCEKKALDKGARAACD